MSQHKPAVVKIPMPCVREESIDGEQLLIDTKSFIKRFCAFPDENCLVAVTLWAAHAHMVEEFHTTPRLALLSPEAASGKTRVLEVLDLLVPESLFTLNASPAAVFRTLDKRQITLLFDEVDAVWSRRGKDDNHEDLRSLLNAGYKRGATIPRCVGPQHEVVNFKVYCAVALAGLGDLPDTIMSRCVIVRMRRRGPTEHVDPFRIRQHEALGHAIRDRLTEWAAVVGESAGKAWPEMPEGIVDRPAEVWEPLIAVADVAGGDWPLAVRNACVALCRIADDRQASLGVRLLADLRIVFGDAHAIHTSRLIDLLSSEDSELEADAPWANLRGRPIGSRRMASILRPYGIRSQKIKIDGKSLQGYRRESLQDAWNRYLPSLKPAQAEPPEPFGFDTTNPHEEVPQVPDTRTSESACARCAGEGCDWCTDPTTERPCQERRYD